MFTTLILICAVLLVLLALLSAYFDIKNKKTMFKITYNLSLIVSILSIVVIIFIGLYKLVEIH